MEHSDVGNGTHAFRTYALRVACLNGMTRKDLLKQVHLGGRLADSVEFSDRTHRLDTAASVSALRDVVRAAFGPAARERVNDAIRAAHERTMSPTQRVSVRLSVCNSVQNDAKSALFSGNSSARPT